MQSHRRIARHRVGKEELAVFAAVAGVCSVVLVIGKTQQRSCATSRGSVLMLPRVVSHMRRVLE